MVVPFEQYKLAAVDQAFGSVGPTFAQQSSDRWLGKCLSRIYRSKVASVKLNPLPPGRIIIRKYPNGPVPRATGNRDSEPRAGLAFPSDSFLHIASQLIVNPLPGAVLPPDTEIMVSDIPRWQIVRQHPPCSAAAHLIRDSAHDLAPWILAGQPPGFTAGISGSMRLHWLGQIGRVRLTFFHSF